MYYFQFVSLVVTCFVMYVVATDKKKIQQILHKIHKDILFEHYKPRTNLTYYKNIENGLKEINLKISGARDRRPMMMRGDDVRLVAVSKTKPKEFIIAAYMNGQRCFGENYVQELLEKSTDPEILERCKHIEWHFIGNLQSNKVKKLVSVPNLSVIETVDSEKLARLLNDAWEYVKVPTSGKKLRIMIQINTSGEKAKNGIEPDEAPKLAKFINNQDNLELAGLMTIGRRDHDPFLKRNPDYQCLIKTRRIISDDLVIPLEDLDLSMGMSDDFEHAIEMGSTSVRVGSYIFGGREYKKKVTLLDNLTN